MSKIVLRQFNQGGIAPSKYEGRANSLAESVGVNFHDVPGVFFANWALSKESSTTIDSLVKVMVVSSDNKVYAFSSTSGKVWARATNGTWSLVYTTSPETGAAGCLGAVEYNGYIYWATQSRLHRIAVADTADWATNAVPDWKDFLIGDAEYHPMLVMDNRLYIGDGSNLVQVRYDSDLDDTLFTGNALRIYPPQRIKCLAKLDFDILIGSVVDSYVNKSTIYRWNRYSDSWIVEDELDSLSINAFIPVDNYVLISAGVNGEIFSYDGQFMELIYQLPGIYSSAAQVTIHPEATAYYLGKPIFGVSNVTGNPVSQGVYSLATKNPALYPRVLNLEYVISTGHTSSIEIGAIEVRGNELFVAWKDGTSYGVDKISTTTRYNGAYIVSRIMTIDRDLEDNLHSIIAEYASMPSGCSLSAYLKASHASSWGTAIALTDDTVKKIAYSDEMKVGTNFQLKIVFNTTGIYTPEVEAVKIEVNKGYDD